MLLQLKLQALHLTKLFHHLQQQVVSSILTIQIKQPQSKPILFIYVMYLGKKMKSLISRILKKTSLSLIANRSQVIKNPIILKTQNFYIRCLGLIINLLDQFLKLTVLLILKVMNGTSYGVLHLANPIFMRA